MAKSKSNSKPATSRPRHRRKPEEPKPVAERFDDRAGMRLLQRAVTEGWRIPEEVYKGAPVICAKILWNEQMPISYRLRASEVLSAMNRDKLQAAVALDRMERLENNEATERIAITPEMQAIADRLVARRLGNDTA
jgi:hypothetical protein